MNLAWTGPADWLLPGLFVVTWLALWVTRRVVPGWFYAVGLVLVVLCLPAAKVANGWEINETNCGPREGTLGRCMPGDWPITILINAGLGFVTLGALALGTLVVMSVLALSRLVRATDGGR